MFIFLFVPLERTRRLTGHEWPPGLKPAAKISDIIGDQQGPTFKGMPAMMEKCSDCGRLACTGEFVTISVAEYERIQRLADGSAGPNKPFEIRRLSRSPIVRDRELAKFILDCSSTMFASEIRAACRAKFGPHKVPSVSAIYRFLDQFAKYGSKRIS